MKIKITIEYGDRVESYELSRYYMPRLQLDVNATPLAALHMALGFSPKFTYKSLTIEVTERE